MSHYAALAVCENLAKKELSVITNSLNSYSLRFVIIRLHCPNEHEFEYLRFMIKKEVLMRSGTDLLFGKINHEHFFFPHYETDNTLR